MSATVAIAVLLGALLHAFWNLFIRATADTKLNTTLVAGGGGLLSAFWLPFAPLPASASWPYLAASVLIHLAYFSLVAYLYGNLELSFAYPLMRGSAPALSAVAAAVLLHESPSRFGWLGILLISLGILTLAGDSWRSGLLRSSPTVLALANAAVIVVYTLVDGVGARLSNHPGSYTGWLFFLTAIPLLARYSAKKGKNGVKEFCGNWRKTVLGGACTVASYGLALWAMTQAPIALVAAFRESSVLFGTLLAAAFLGERVTPLRYLSVLVVCSGAVAIKMS